MFLRLSRFRNYHIKWIQRVRALHWLYSSMNFRRYNNCAAMSISMTYMNILSKSLMNIVVSCESINNVKNSWFSLQLIWKSWLMKSLRDSIKKFIIMILFSLWRQKIIINEWVCKNDRKSKSEIHILMYSSERTRIDRDSFNFSWIVSWICFVCAREKDWWKTKFR
jgi:hypothetical protein